VFDDLEWRRSGFYAADQDASNRQSAREDKNVPIFFGLIPMIQKYPNLLSIGLSQGTAGDR
jgi:hypothetical protein